MPSSVPNQLIESQMKLPLATTLVVAIMEVGATMATVGVIAEGQKLSVIPANRCLVASRLTVKYNPAPLWFVAGGSRAWPKGNGGMPELIIEPEVLNPVPRGMWCSMVALCDAVLFSGASQYNSVGLCWFLAGAPPAIPGLVDMVG